MATHASPSLKKEHLEKLILDELIHIFANTYTLHIKTQSFHWNVTGPHFFSLHKMFEEQSRELAESIDSIAERLRILKVQIPGSFSQLIKLSSIKETKTVPTAKEMMKHLMHDNEILSHQTHMLRDIAQKAQDDASVELLIELKRAHEKAAWMLRSSLELG